MKVLHLLMGGGVGGIEVFCRDLARFSGHENVFYLVYSGGVMAQEIERCGGRVVVAGEKKQTLLPGLWRFLRFCKREKPDVIISHAGSVITRGFLAASAYVLPGAVRIVYFHSNALLRPGGPAGALADGVCRLAYRKSRFGAAISQSVRQSWLTALHLAPEKLKVVYNGVCLSDFYALPAQPGTPMEILYVGRLAPVKGLDTAIRALAMLPDAVDFRFTVVGGGAPDYLAYLQRLVYDGGLQERVFFAGETRSPAALYAGADVFVHPATAPEGFGITLVEAMASGLPCVAFACGASPELIEDNVCGFLVPEKTDRALSRTLAHVWQLYSTGGLGAYAAAAKKRAAAFSIERSVQTLESLYLEAPPPGENGRQNPK